MTIGKDSLEQIMADLAARPRPSVPDFTLSDDSLEKFAVICDETAAEFEALATRFRAEKVTP